MRKVWCRITVDYYVFLKRKPPYGIAERGVGGEMWIGDGFGNTVKGAPASAVIYSLVETAGANGLSERGYLHIVLSNLPSMDFRQHPELLKDLMPWSDYMRSCFEQE